MRWIFDSPWMILILGIAIEGLLSVFFLSSRSKLLLSSMIGVALIFGGLLVVERVVVTDQEEVSDTLDGIAAAMESGDLEHVMASFSPSCSRYREIKNGLYRFKVSKARVGGDLEVRLNKLTNPPSATAYFTGRIDGHERLLTDGRTGDHGVLPYEHMIRKFKITLHKHSQQWLIAEVEDDDARSAQAR